MWRQQWQRERQKSNRFSKSAKQQLCTCITLFCTFHLPSLHDYNVKMSKCTFYRGRRQATTKFSCSLWTCMWFLGIQLRQSSLTFWQSKYIDIIPMKILKLEFTFKRRFYCRRHPLISSSQILISHENTKESTAEQGKKVNSTIKSVH